MEIRVRMRMPRSVWLAPLVCALMVLQGAMASATTMTQLSTEHLVRRADAVAVVTIGHVSTVHAGARIWTQAEATVRDAIKGTAAGATLRILTPGGADGRYGQYVEGAATFREGESCIVFLARSPSGSYEPVGMEQGKLTIETGASGSIVRRTFTAERVERAPDGTLRPAPAMPETEAMEPFLAQLRQLAGGAR